MQSRFTRWLRTNGPRLGSAAFELKAVSCDGKIERGHGKTCGPLECRSRLSASRLSEGQEEALCRVAGTAYDSAGGFRNGRLICASEETGLAYKISDSAVGYKPFDCFYLYRVPAFVVVGWDCGSRPLRTYMVDIRAWLEWRGDRKRAGMGEGEAQRLGEAIMI